MRHRLAILTATAALSVGAVATGTASAASPTVSSPVVAAAAPAHEIATAPTAKRGLRCVAAGVKTLISLDLLRDAALRKVDYSTLADPETGPIFTTLPAGSYLSLGEVIRLHVTNPELFAWCR